MKTARTLFILAALAPLCLAAAAAQEKAPTRKFKIYCVEGTVRVESLTEDELRKECEGPICDLARTEFIRLSLARRASKRFGGVGAPCECAAKGAEY